MLYTVPIIRKRNNNFICGLTYLAALKKFNSKYKP